MQKLSQNAPQSNPIQNQNKEVVVEDFEFEGDSCDEFDNF